MKGWVGLVGWPVANGLPTLVVTHQLQVERRTGKVRWPETDVLPLCHATNWVTDSKKIQWLLEWDFLHTGFTFWWLANNVKVLIANDYTLLSVHAFAARSLRNSLASLALAVCIILSRWPSQQQQQRNAAMLSSVAMMSLLLRRQHYRQNSLLHCSHYITINYILPQIT